MREKIFKGFILNNKLNENAKTILARLLATENISVEFDSSIKTAAFDPKNRVLIMPVFEDVSTDVDSLFIGHECGHALFTPHDSIEEVSAYKKKGLKDLVNIVEDARIEKMMQKKFGGLHRCFYNAYNELFEKNFFGVVDTDLNTLSFENRINLHFKMGSRAGIRFSDEEQNFVDRIDNASTWEEVVTVSNDLYDYVTSQNDNDEDEEHDSIGQSSEGTNTSNEQQNTDTDFGSGDSDEDEDGDSQSSDEADEEADETKESSGVTGQANSDDDQGSEGSESSEGSEDVEEDDLENEQEPNQSKGGINGNEIDTSTQNNFDSSQQKLVDQDSHRDVNNLKLPVFNFDNLVVTPTEIKQLIEQNIHYMSKNYPEYNPATYSDAVASATLFKTSQKSAVNLMAKEFEMKKSAAEHQRTRVAKTGVLNPNKLHSYRFNEDIFLRQNIVSDGKNHGFIMFLDWSSSMRENMADTISQVQLLALFCKKVNVPFEVYAFSNSKSSLKSIGGHDRFDNIQLPVANTFKVTDCFKLFQFFKSGMKNTDFNNAFINLEYIKNGFKYYLNNSRGIGNGIGAADDKYWSTPSDMGLSGTPLGETIMAAIPLVEKFKKENSLQVVNTVFLTDGAGQMPTDYYYTPSTTQYISNGQDCVYIQDQGRVYKTSVSSHWNLYNELWKTLYKILKDRTGCSLTGFYISPNRKNHFKREAGHLFVGQKRYSWEVQDETFTAMKKNDYISIDYCGFDSFILIPTNKLNLDEDKELAVDSEMTKAKMANAFIKNRKNNQTNKKMLKEFVEIVA